MPIYCGKSKDGSDAIQVGVYPSPCGNFWMTEPYTKEQREDWKITRIHWKCYDHINKYRRTLREEYHLILSRQSRLPKACRNYIVSIFKDETS